MTMMMNGMINNEVNHFLFHSMGIPVHITLVGINNADGKKNIDVVEEIFNTYDKRFSRFKDTSELYKLNTSNGEWTPVSIQMFEVLKKCVSLAKETHGAFDPSVGGVLASYGYGLPENFISATPLPTYKSIEFNDRELSIRLASGQILEPASIVKGMAIDEAGKSLLGAKISGFLINAGGDIITHGAYIDRSAWNIAIQDPRNLDAIVATVALKNSGMATSGTYQTHGMHNNSEWHHLVDMRTGNPSNGLVSATVIAETCEEADTEASLAILLSEEEAISRLEMRGLPYFVIHKDGKVSKNVPFSTLEIPLHAVLNN